MPVTSTGTEPGSAGAKRSDAQMGLPMRFSPINRMAVKAVQITSILVLP